MSTSSIHVCKNCGHQFDGKFCNQCGEKIVAENEKQLSHLFAEAFHFITHLDSKFLKTVRLVLFRPGFVSKEYCEGKRKKYFKPVSLYLIVVVIYLLFPLLQGMNLSFANHINNNRAFGITYSRTWALKKMEKKNLTEKQLAQDFDKTSLKLSKLLLLVLLPLTALALALLFPGRKAYFFDHFILATELNTIFLLLFFLLLPALLILVSNLFGVHISYGDTWTFIALQLILFLTVLVSAFRRFYSVSYGRAAVSTFLFIVLYAVSIFIYRQLVFVIVMLTI